MSAEREQWAEASSLESGRADMKQKIRFNIEQQESLSVAESVSECDFTNLISSLVETNKLLHDEIKQIQKDHRRTLKTLSHCCQFGKQNEEKSPEQHQYSPRGILKKNSKSLLSKEKKSEACKKNKVSSVKKEKSEADKSLEVAASYSNENEAEEVCEIRSCSNSSGPLSEDDTGSCDYEATVEELALPEKRGGRRGRHAYPKRHSRSPGIDTIKTMWDNFSLNDYDFVTYADGPIVKTKPSSNRQHRRITIPEPFKMTVRESSKKHKCGDSSKSVTEDPEMDVRVQPVEVPPSTLLPIYELMRARDEHKKEERKKDVINKLKSTLRPFSFDARESQKLERKEELTNLEGQEFSKPKTFKARPVPSKVFDPEVKERMLEEEDYRRIRRKMRSYELLANSKLPRRMHKSAQSSRKPEYSKKSCPDEEEHWFHPQISHEIPDYEERHMRLRNKLAERKSSKILTVPEPFYLKTEEVSQRRRHKESSKARRRRNEEMNSKKSRSSSRLHLPRHPVIFAPSTQAQKLRQKKIDEMRAVLQVKELEEEEKHRAKKMERQMLQKIVKETADKMYSPALELEEKRRKQAEERK